MLHLVLRLRGGWQLTVKAEEGRTFFISAQDSDDIETLKERICDSTGIPPESQILLYRGTEMRDGQFVICLFSP